MKVVQHGDKFSFEVEGENAVDCFDKLAKLSETFNVPPCTVNDSGEPSTNYEPVVREVADKKNPKQVYTYREFRSKEAPYARLNLGRKQDNLSLFPKVWDKENQQAIGINGWVTGTGKETE